MLAVRHSRSMWFQFAHEFVLATDAVRQLHVFHNCSHPIRKYGARCTIAEHTDQWSGWSKTGMLALYTRSG